MLAKLKGMRYWIVIALIWQLSLLFRAHTSIEVVEHALLILIILWLSYRMTKIQDNNRTTKNQKVQN